VLFGSLGQRKAKASCRWQLPLHLAREGIGSSPKFFPDQPQVGLVLVACRFIRRALFYCKYMAQKESNVLYCELMKLRKKRWKIIVWAGLSIVALLVAVFVVWQSVKPVPTTGDWKDTLKVLSTADFNGNVVTVKNVRNFQYDASGTPLVETYYDKTYDLNKLEKVWYVAEPFNPGSPFAHTFLSFQFSDGAYLAITIEARLLKSQQYGIVNGFLHTFPLMYIAADERDVVYVRTNINKQEVYLYPVRATPSQARLLLVDMLERMNDLSVHPAWYNDVYANCTSSIANHINKIWPGLLPKFDWEVLFTSYADQLALSRGLLDTNLSLSQARKKFYVTDRAQKIGYRDNFSTLIRQSF